MSQRDEKRMFDWLDEMELGQKELGDVASSDEDQPESAGLRELNASADLARIKTATFAKLGLEPPGSLAEPWTTREPIESPVSRLTLSQVWRGLNRKRNLLVASVLFLAVISGVALSSPEVRAQVRKAIQFLPGYGVVQETGEDQVRYVLPSVVTIPVDKGTVEIRAIQVGDKMTSMLVVGSQGVSKVESVMLVNGKGDRYSLIGAWQGSGREWMSEFYVRTSIKVTDNMQLEIEELGINVAIHLVPANQHDRIEDLGSTSFSNGISLTAVNADSGSGRKRVTLIPQLPEGTKLDTFGFYDFDAMEKPTLRMDGNVPIEIERDEAFPRPNEFYYTNALAGAQAYRLTVPSIRVKKTLEKPAEIQVPIPEKGVLDYRKPVSLGGFPIDIVKVERIERNEQGTPVNNLRIYFDPHYDPSATQSLLDFNLDYTKLSSGTMHDERTWAIQYMEVPIETGAKKEITLPVQDVLILYRGPWKLEWSPD